MDKTTTIAILSVLILCTLALLPAAAATRGNTLLCDDSTKVIEVDADGNVVWEVNATTLSTLWFNPQDADRLPNGNTLIADYASYGKVLEVDGDGNIVWELNQTTTPELYGPMDADRLPNGNTLIAQSSPQKVIEVDPDGNVVWRVNQTTTPEVFEVPFRQAQRLPDNNTLLVGDGCGFANIVIEVDPAGNVVWEVNATTTLIEGQIGGAERLPDNNTLIAECDDTNYVYRVIEVDRDLNIVWEVNQTTTPGLAYPEHVKRLPDGNTLFMDYNDWNEPRLIEVDSAGNIVWEVNETVIEGTEPWWPWHWITDAERIVERIVPSLEFGDAQDPTYPSLLASDGARHSDTDTECLGLNITGTDWKDFELDANVPDADLLDDGLLTLTLTTNNPAQTVDFEVTNNITDDTLLVNILLDLNGDGDWNDVVGTQSEHVVQNQPITPLVGPADGTFTSTPFSTVGATIGQTWMRVTLTRQSINPGWNGTMASAGYAEPFGCGETEDWEVMLEEMIIPAVETATGTGTATFESDAGTIVDLTAVAEGTLPAEGKPVGMTFPHGFFSFNITGLTSGQTVTVTITLPDAVPVGTQYWKYIGSAWVQIPIGSDDGDNVITIQLTDGGPGDADGLADGTIVDPGGSGTPPTPPEVPAMTPLGFVMVMFSLFGLVVFATRTVNKR